MDELEIDSIRMDQIAALFGVQEDLGCGASLEEYTSWYNSLGIETIDVVDYGVLYTQYQAICSGVNTNTIPETQTTTSPSVSVLGNNVTIKSIAILGGVYLIYKGITSK